MYEVARACSELSLAFYNMAEVWKNKGIRLCHVKSKQDDYNIGRSFFDARSAVRVSEFGGSTSIYPANGNTNLRFWHDCVHFSNKLDFSLESEKKVIAMQINGLVLLGVSREAIKVFEIDMLGQIEYYYENGKYVDDQKKFLYSNLGL